MDQNFHLIEKYFQGKLDADELQLFNEMLQKDAAFEQEFRDMKLLRDAVKETSRIKALHMLQNIEATLAKEETTKINVSMKRLVSIAASLIIIATVSYFAISSGTGALTGEQVFDTYYEPYINLKGPERGASLEITTLSARAYNAYDIADYNTSANLFAELLKVEKSAENFLYSGIANLEAGNFKDAKNNLNTVMNNFAEFGDQAQWYLAMTLFKEGVVEEAIANVADIAFSGEERNIVSDAKDVLLKMGLKTLDSDVGSVGNETKVPATGEDSPDGSIEEVRQYQYGTVIAQSGLSYPFFNDSPMKGLKSGDLVEYILITGRNRKSMAVIIDRLDLSMNN